MSTHWPVHYTNPEALFNSQGKDFGQELTHSHAVGKHSAFPPHHEAKTAFSYKSGLRSVRPNQDKHKAECLQV